MTGPARVAQRGASDADPVGGEESGARCSLRRRRSFGIEVFAPSTANTLMAALLVRDLRDPQSASNPAAALHNPMDLFADAANHGGIWRAACEPRSVLSLAAVLGLFVRNA